MRRTHSVHRAPLQDGELYNRLLQLGWELDPDRDKNAVPCPFHDDHRPSAFVSRRNVFYCSVCTPNKGLSAAEFLLRLGAPRSAPCEAAPIRLPAQRTQPSSAEVPLGKVRELWSVAVARVAHHRTLPESEAMAFIRRRGLESAAERGLFGVLERTDEIRYGKRIWHELGVRVVAPLYDLNGEFVSFQGRNVLGAEPRLLFPAGRPAKGTLFSNALGLEVLRGRLQSQRCVVVEGLTDFLAVGSIEGVATLGLPGASMACGVAGDWMRGRDLILAFDADRAGSAAAGEVAARARSLGATSVHAVLWPTGCKDACEFIALNGYECFRDELVGALQGDHHE